MDFAFFEQLTDQEAQALLGNYRAVGAGHLGDLERLVDVGSGMLDFRVASLRPAFELVASEVAIVPTALDDSLPDWIRNSEAYQSGLYQFSDDSRLLVLYLSFYFAETLVRASGGALRWGVGDRDSAVQNQPVLEGFKGGVQLSPLLVTENLLRRLIEEADPCAADDVDRAIATWQGLISRA